MGSLATRLPALVRAPLLRQAGIYTVSNVIVRALPFLLLPVMTRYLTPTDYGIVAMFLLTATFLEPFVGIGFAGAITVKFYDRSIDLPSYVGTGLTVVGALGVAAAALLILVGNPLSEVTQVPADWLVLVAVLVVARSVVSALMALLRVNERAVSFGVIQNAQSLALVLLTLLLVVGLGYGWQGRAAAELVAWVVFAAFAVAYLWRHAWMRAVFDRRYARHLLRFGIPLIPHALGAVMIVQTDRLFLTNMVGVEETGLYIVGFQLALIVEVIAVSFNNAYTPWLYRRLSDGDAATKRRLVRYTYVQFGVMACIAAATAIVMPWLAGWLLDPSFAASAQYVGWFALAFLFSAMYYMVTNYIFYAQRTAWLAAVTISVAILNVPLTFLLITLNGGVGAAQAMTIALGLTFVMTWIVSERAYPMPWLSALRKPQEPG